MRNLSRAAQIHVGGIPTYDLEKLSDTELQFSLEGAPTPGRAEVVIHDGATALPAGYFEYNSPIDPIFDRLVVFGASLSMGMQDGTISPHSQLAGVAAQFGQAVGAYLPIPLVKEGYMPGLTADDFDRQTCVLQGGTLDSIVGARVEQTLVPKITLSDGQLRAGLARKDPAIEARDLGVGGFRITHVVQGASTILGALLEHFVWDVDAPSDKLLENPSQTMLDRVVALKPTLAISFDLLANDVNNVKLYGDGIPDVNALTPLEAFHGALIEILAALDSTGAQVFIGNCPDVTGFSMYQAKVEALRQEGFAEEDATGWLLTIQSRIAAFNAALWAEAPKHPRIHIVDVNAKVASAFLHGIDAGGAHLSPQPFGGLTSLDGLHFSDTGYAVLAQEFLDAIRDQLGVDVPWVDLPAVHATDPYSREALAAQGFACARN